ncbi:glutamine--fructose-6-phosphate transaminase (isomerizing) [Paenibacillus sedimenti]|uniref:Glutamine--fructose-6-phosphate aminotransferase [isomerizing] n=1 Tax=Paenibacillus sedimenti TaxID=2770274 RepID=A0A926KWL4_9BACL|nr:glutamine--fructose-6-phosphate transaminase (isomerizing) [Paenibacillus sedimenti]MBD0384216.1 glutamine--fructose-6-phosphate transaminase (isomerizing) [Paenibacillus sedimenti]
MCGIVGYIGKRDSQNILLEGLKKLEYRGYDSAGLAIHTSSGLELRKSKGRISELENRLEAQPLAGSAGIGHTRWATHGKPSDANSHPHTDNDMKISVVHNGIIENHLQLKEELELCGYQFISETDTEVISHLIAHHYEGDLTEAVRKAVSQVRGAYAIAVLSEHEPDKLVAVRWASPLIIGVGEGENFIGSDIPAILEHTRNVYILNDGEMAVLTREGVKLMTLEGNFIAKQLFRIDWDLMVAEKNGFDSFMLKEIHDQPRAYEDTMRGRIEARSTIVLPGIELSEVQIRGLKQIHMVACGTAYHAALVGKTVIERLTRIPVEVDLASEYRYRMPVIRKNTLVIAVSQSGETADTLAAMREAKQWGARVMAITNVIGSSVAREADDCLFTLAGPEIAVASTKAYSSQLIAFYLLGIFMAQSLETLDQATQIELITMLERLPAQVEDMLKGNMEAVRQIAEQIAGHNHLFFIGRGLDYSLAMEASLKLKEISYLHSEAYAAGELKHGSLALVEDGTPVIALATQELLLEKTVSNIKEVKARGAYVIAFALEGNTELEKTADQVIYVPRTFSLFTPALAVVPLQLLAYYTASIRGNDVDKPRNLAKSVTVE